jgi:hypothetical protein
LPPADRVTRGDAEAVLQAAGTGGLVLLARGATTPRTIPGAPADADRRATIRPFDAPHGAGGRHFCAEDWHVIVLAIIDGGDASFTRQDAEANPVTLSFTLDGEPLSTTRTALKRSLDPDLFDFEEAWWFQEGRVMAPADLSVGSHRLVVVESDQEDPLEITFFIDAPATGACL